MKVALIVLAVLLVILLLPFSAVVRYDQSGLFAWAKVLFIRVRVFPAKEKKEKKEKEKDPKKQEKPKKDPSARKKKEQEEAPEKGGKLEMVRAALPLIKPALVGLKRRLTIRRLDLHVTWAGTDPADTAMGYGCANAALGTLWSVLDQNFKVKKSRLGASVSFDDPAPTVYLHAVISLNLWRALTLALPLLIRFLRNYSRLKREAQAAHRDKITKKEA